MIYVLGSAINIRCAIDAENVEDTTLTLESIIDPNGVELITIESVPFLLEDGSGYFLLQDGSKLLASNGELILVYGTDDEANIGSIIWQSTTSNAVGRYKFIIKALNGTRESFAKGYFMLEER